MRPSLFWVLYLTCRVKFFHQIRARLTLLKGGFVVVAASLAFLWFVVIKMLAVVRNESHDPKLKMWAVIGLGTLAALAAAATAAESFRTLSSSAPFWILAGAIPALLPSDQTIFGHAQELTTGEQLRIRGSASNG